MGCTINWNKTESLGWCINTAQKLPKTKKYIWPNSVLVNKKTNHHCTEIICSKLDSYGKTVELRFLSEADFLQNMCTRQLFTIQAKTYVQL